MINKHKSNKIKENSNTVRHLNNGTDHRHLKSCCDQSSPARRTIRWIVKFDMKACRNHTKKQLSIAYDSVTQFMSFCYLENSYSVSFPILHAMEHVILVAISWWRHQMATFSALLALCAGNSPVSGEFPSQKPVTRSFRVFFALRLIKRLSKHSRGWWFETLSHPLWRQGNVELIFL